MTLTTAATTPSCTYPSAAEQLADLHAHLCQHFDAQPRDRVNDDAVLSGLATLLREHCHLKRMTLLLSSIIASPTLLASIAARSYWHGNGFLKVVLLDHGYKLRLHIWFAGTACEENIHSHRWGFASHVLTGTLKSELWADAANDGALDNQRLCADEYVYTAKHEQGDTHVPAHKRYVGMTCLQKQQNLLHGAGASYVMTPSQLHRINHPGQALVATVICTAPTPVLTNRLFPTIPDPKLQPAHLSADELKQALTRYLSHEPLAA